MAITNIHDLFYTFDPLPYAKLKDEETWIWRSLVAECWNPPADGWCLYYCLVVILRLLRKALPAFTGIEISGELFLIRPFLSGAAAAADVPATPDEARHLGRLLLNMRSPRDVDVYEKRQRTSKIPLYYGGGVEIQNLLGLLLKKKIYAYILTYTPKPPSSASDSHLPLRPEEKKLPLLLNTIEFPFISRHSKEEKPNIDKGFYLYWEDAGLASHYMLHFPPPSRKVPLLRERKGRRKSSPSEKETKEKYL